MKVRLERMLWIAGTMLVLGVGVAFVYNRVEQQRGAETLRQMQAAANTPGTATAPPQPVPLKEGDVFGKIRIERLGLEAVIFEGTTNPTLAKGVGHMTLGDAANFKIALAAHRDTHFRPVRNIRNGDRITLDLPAESRQYQVDRTFVVRPKDTYILDPETQSSLVLITCYPFNFIGHAPKRFIVHATRVIPGEEIQQSRVD